MKRNLSLLLTLVMVTSTILAFFGTALAASASDWPEYLNLENGDAYYPIVKEGMGDNIVLTMAITQPVNGGNWDDLWISKVYRDFMNINFEVEQILETALIDRRNLMLASNDLPDVMINLGLTTIDLMKYGFSDSLLMDLKPYLDEELMPDLMKLLAKRPDALGAMTAPDGKIYSLTSVGSADDEAAGVRLFTDQRWLKACGLENPKTLDEFIDMLRAYKAADVNNVGADQVVPLAAGFEFGDPQHYIMNAFGWVTRLYANNRSYDPALRNGEVELPVNNPEIFIEYLRVMKLLFDEGLLYKNFFITPADGTEVNGIVLEGRAGVYIQPIYVIGYDDWDQWIGLHPLTSAWHDTPEWPMQNATNVGNFVLSAKNPYPELTLRFANSYYGADARMLWVGPMNGSEIAMGVSGVRWNEATRTEDFVQEGWPEGINDIWTYLMMVQGPMPQFAATDLPENMAAYREKWLEAPPQSLEKTFNLTNPDQFYRASLYENSAPYFTTSFPGVYYLDEETVARMDDLRAVIKPYVDEAFAQFVTGIRSLDEFDAFQAELKSMGIDDLEAIYKQIWEDYKKAQ